MEIRRLTDGVYAILTEIGHPDGDSNFGLIVGEDGAALIDCDIRRWGDVQRMIRSVTDAPVRYLINTHDNFDHASGNALFSPGGTVILATEACRRILASDADDLRSRVAAADAGGALPGPDVPERALLPGITTSTGLTVHLGGRALELVPVGHTHTPGDLVVYLAGERILFAGDVLFEGCHPVARNADIENWMRVLSELKERPISLTVPGHGRIRSGCDNMETLRDYFTVVISRVRELRDRGLSLAQVQEEIEFPEFEAWGKGRWLPSTVERIYEDLQ
ncbi:MAG: MBL fold metallo-hydrolase [Bacillota bacterium]